MGGCGREIKVSTDTGRALTRLLDIIDKGEVYEEKCGYGIDHRKAVIVFVEGKEEEIKLISPKEEKQHRQSGVSMPADDIRQRELRGK